MKKQNEILAELHEKKSQHGNTYFSGKLEGGGILILKKKKDKKSQFGHQIWELVIGD